MKHSIVWVVPWILLVGSIGCQGNDENPTTPSNPTAPVTEIWSAVFDNDSGFTGQFTLKKTSQDQIIVTGNWCRWCGAVATYTGIATLNDSILTLTGSGTVNNDVFPSAYRTCTYTLSIQGVVTNGSCEGTYSWTFASDYWQVVAAHIGNSFAARRTGGSNITD